MSCSTADDAPRSLASATSPATSIDLRCRRLSNLDCIQHMGRSLDQVKRLNVSCNSLKDFSALSLLSTLQDLSIASNCLEEVAWCYTYFHFINMCFPSCLKS